MVWGWGLRSGFEITRVVPNSNLHNYRPKPKYLIIVGSFGPLGFVLHSIDRTTTSIILEIHQVENTHESSLNGALGVRIGSIALIFRGLGKFRV